MQQRYLNLCRASERLMEGVACRACRGQLLKLQLVLLRARQAERKLEQLRLAEGSALVQRVELAEGSCSSFI